MVVMVEILAAYRKMVKWEIVIINDYASLQARELYNYPYLYLAISY